MLGVLCDNGTKKNLGIFEEVFVLRDRQTEHRLRELETMIRARRAFTLLYQDPLITPLETKLGSLLMEMLTARFHIRGRRCKARPSWQQTAFQMSPPC